MELTLVVSDCPALEPGTGPTALGEAGVPPDMPALESLLRLADHAPAGADWRSALWGQWHAAGGGAGVSPLAPPAASVAAAALAGVSGDVWLVQPVHLQAAMDHLRLHSAGLLRLAEEEAAELAADFARVFGGDGLALHPLCGRFVLTGLAAGEGPPDPGGHAGTRLAAPLRSGSAPLRRLVGETELWLHDHAVNRARTRRGELAVTALWIWGAGQCGGQAVRASPRGSRPAPLFLGDDPWLAGLAALRGGHFRPAPAGLRADAGIAALEGGEVTLQFSAAGQLSATEPPLSRLDREVIAPLAASFRRGELARLELLVGELRASLRPAHRRRFWRRSRRWWEHARR